MYMWVVLGHSRQLYLHTTSMCSQVWLFHSTRSAGQYSTSGLTVIYTTSTLLMAILSFHCCVVFWPGDISIPQLVFPVVSFLISLPHFLICFHFPVVAVFCQPAQKTTISTSLHMTGLIDIHGDWHNKCWRIYTSCRLCRTDHRLAH